MSLAVFKCLKCTGTNAATETDVSKAPNFLNIDGISSNPANYPIKRPPTIPSNPTYSYEMWLRWECTTAPDNACENFKMWGANHQPDHEDNPGDCLFVLWGTTGTAATPTDSASSIATVEQYKESTGTGYYSFGTALSIGVVPGDDKINAVGEKTEYLVAQLKVAGGAQHGNMENQVWMLTWEES